MYRSQGKHACTLNRHLCIGKFLGGVDGTMLRMGILPLLLAYSVVAINSLP